MTTYNYINLNTGKTKICKFPISDLGFVYHNIDDLPAVVKFDDYFSWYKYGIRHRINGPARFWKYNNKKEYFVNGNEIYIPDNIKNNEEQIKEYLQIQANF